MKVPPNTTCVNCSSPAQHLHHIVPRSLGGSNRKTNLAPVCEACHSLIHDTNFLRVSILSKEGQARASAERARLGIRKREQGISVYYSSQESAIMRRDLLCEILKPLVELDAPVIEMAHELDDQGIRPPNGRKRWTPVEVQLALAHLGLR